MSNDSAWNNVKEKEAKEEQRNKIYKQMIETIGTFSVDPIVVYNYDNFDVMRKVSAIQDEIIDILYSHSFNKRKDIIQDEIKNLMKTTFDENLPFEMSNVNNLKAKNNYLLNYVETKLKEVKNLALKIVP